MSLLSTLGALPAAPPINGEFSSEIAYSSGLWHFVEYSFAVAGFALFAGAVYSLMSRHEISPRYRSAAHGSALLQAVAALAYVALFVSWHNGFVYAGGSYVPAPDVRFDGGLRYADWSVTVPLLAIELLAVTTLVGAALSRARYLAAGAAFLMIITGYFGAAVFDNGTSTTWLNVWAAVSTVFFIVMYAVLGKAVLDSRRELSAETYTGLLRSTIVLFSIFGAYPLLYLVQVLVGPSSNLVVWAIVVQVGFSFSDILAKVGFGAMIHKVAKMRTAEDLAAGRGSADEPVYVNNELKAERYPTGVGGNGTSAAATRAG